MFLLNASYVQGTWLITWECTKIKDTILDLKELKNLHKSQLGTETVPRFKAGGRALGRSDVEAPHNMRTLGHLVWARNFKRSAF